MHRLVEELGKALEGVEVTLEQSQRVFAVTAEINSALSEKSAAEAEVERLKQAASDMAWLEGWIIGCRHRAVQNIGGEIRLVDWHEGYRVIIGSGPTLAEAIADARGKSDG